MTRRRPRVLRTRPALRSRLTLRGRLTVVLTAVLLVATAASGLAAVLLLRAFLLGRLDGQLADAGSRYVAGLEHGRGGLGPGGSDGDADNAAPGLSVGTLGVRLVGGIVQQSALVASNGSNQTPTLDDGDRRTLAGLRTGAAPTTVGLSSLGEYRVQAVAGHDGDVLVTGLPEHEVDETVGRLVTIDVIVDVVAIAVAIGVTLWSVRRSLRPLEAVAATARHVSSLPLTTPGVLIPTDSAPAHPTTEADQVAAAFDRMLGHVRSALAARDATEQRLRRFVADASHELRTPLATVRAYAEYAEREGAPLTEPTAQALARIDAAGERMSVLVEELLVLARLDEDRPLRREPLDLSQLVIEVVVDAQTATPDHVWRLDLPEEPVTHTGDADALHRAVANLVTNAARHTPAGTTVTVGLTTDADRITVTVADDGPGIPEEHLATLFARFTRVDAGRASETGGSGLGLAITRAVVRAHGGTVSVSSRPGDTRFTTTLPRHPPLGSL